MTTAAYDDVEALLEHLEAPIDEEELRALECDAEGLAELHAEFEIYLEDRRKAIGDFILYMEGKYPRFLQDYCGFPSYGT